jgi:hypothetical protein
MSVKADSTRILVTLSRDLKKRLESRAKEDNRAVSNYVAFLIQQDLKKREEKEG